MSGKTRVSVFVSHNKKLNCLFKDLIKEESIKEYRKNISDAREYIKEQEKEICTNPPEQWGRSNCLKCPEDYIDNCYSAIGLRQDGGADWKEGKTEEQLDKYWKDQSESLIITINGKQSIYTPGESKFRYLNKAGSNILSFNKARRYWTISNLEDLNYNRLEKQVGDTNWELTGVKYILIPEGQLRWVVNMKNYGLLKTNNKWKIYKKGITIYEDLIDIDIKILTQKEKDTSGEEEGEGEALVEGEGEALIEEEESFNCTNPPSSTTIEKCEEKCENSEDFSLCELSVRLNRSRSEYEKEASAEIRRRKEEEAFSKSIEEKESPHFINGAVIKLEYNKGDEKYTINLINSSEHDIINEIAKNKVEHTKDNHEVWFSGEGKGDHKIILEKINSEESISQDKETYSYDESKQGGRKGEGMIELTLRIFKQLKNDIPQSIKDNLENIPGVNKFVLYFVRHGEGWHNLKSKKLYHMIDSNLTKKGIADGMHAALTIYDDLKNKHGRETKEFKFFTSDLHRSQQTNDIIYRFLKFRKLFKHDDSLYQIPCLHEIDGSCKPPSKKVYKPSSTPINPYEPIYWPNHEKSRVYGGKDDDIYVIENILLQKNEDGDLIENNRFIDKMVSSKSLEHKAKVIEFFRDAVTLLYYKPPSVNKWEYYPNENDEEYLEKREEIKRLKDKDPEIYKVLESLVKLECRDYEDEQKKRELFQNPKTTKLAVAAATPLILSAAVVGGPIYGAKKYKKNKNKKGGALEVGALSAVLGASVVSAAIAKHRNKPSHCQSINMKDHLDLLVKIGFTWGNWDSFKPSEEEAVDPLSLSLSLPGGGKYIDGGSRSKNKRSNRSNRRTQKKRTRRTQKKRTRRTQKKRTIRTQ